MKLNEFVRLVYSLLVYFVFNNYDHAYDAVHEVLTCYSNTRRGYYSRAVTFSFSASEGAALIQEWRLIESGV